MKKLIALLLGLFLTACTPLMTKGNDRRQAVGEGSADQLLFIQGVEQITQQQDAEILLRLKNNYPESPWSELADTILSLSDQISLQKKQMKQCQRQLDEISSKDQSALMEEQINRCTTENHRLQKELDISNKRLEALRELTIELELKEP